MTRCSQLCASAIKRFARSKEQSCTVSSPYSARYTYEVMQAEIRRAGKKAIACSVRGGDVVLFRVGARSVMMEPVQALPTKAAEARATLDRFIADGCESVLIPGGKSEYMAFYRLVGRGKYKGVKVKMADGSIYLVRANDGR